MLISAVKPGDTIKDFGGHSDSFEVKTIERPSHCSPYLIVNRKYRYDIGAHVQMVEAAKSDDDVTNGDKIDALAFGFNILDKSDKGLVRV